ncbi:MAG TPA: hypothetical protein PLU22_07440 [Polyangiaceae bacterium]|nr:hypothetical protein [Polyangiaceae bacterium]
MPTSWGLTEILLTIFLVGFPLAAAIGTGWGWVRDLAAARGVKSREAEREALRRPAPGSLSLEGLVTGGESSGGSPLLVVRRRHGCLGGPLVFDVPPLALRGDDGALHLVELGPDPDVHHYELLPSAPASPDEDRPAPSGAPVTLRIVGRVRVEGLVPVGRGRWAPPPEQSATLTLLGSDAPGPGGSRQPFPG